MNGGTKLAITTPPFAVTRSSTLSGTLRGWSLSARADEWLKMTGASAASSASSIVSGETWDRSTSIPSRFISLTTSRPNGDRPLLRGSSVAESAQGVLSLWVRVMYRAPSR